ncbi:MAG: hypothetical protein ACO3JT_06680, partial [Candidatus Nanopelagicales bacterium]
MSEPSVGTGRLFRSLRAEGAAADIAVPALSLDQAVGLRTVTLGTAPTSPPAAPATPAPAPAPVPAPTPSDPPAALDSSLEY